MNERAAFLIAELKRIDNPSRHRALGMVELLEHYRVYREIKDELNQILGRSDSDDGQDIYWDDKEPIGHFVGGDFVTDRPETLRITDEEA